MPRFIKDIEVSSINGAFKPDGDEKHIGLVPNNAFLDPWGGTAGGAFVKHKDRKFFFVAFSA